MGLLKCKSCEQWERQYRSLLLETSDLRQARLKAEADWATERKDLVDRVLAIEQPAKALPLLAQSRPLRERPPLQPVLNLPGIPQDMRPKKDS
jgi:hypothetical protein